MGGRPEWASVLGAPARAPPPAGGDLLCGGRTSVHFTVTSFSAYYGTVHKSSKNTVTMNPHCLSVYQHWPFSLTSSRPLQPASCAAFRHTAETLSAQRSLLEPSLRG